MMLDIKLYNNISQNILKVWLMIKGIEAGQIMWKDEKNLPAVDYNIPALFRMKSVSLNSESLIQNTTDPETSNVN